jgi:hypothetical protein
MKDFGEGFSESSIECEKEFNLKVELIFSCSSVEQLLEKVDNLSEKSGIESIVLAEFDLEAGEIIRGMHKISQAAKEKGIDIVMAPNERNSGVSWENREIEMRKNGIIVSGTYEKDLEPESIGFYFSKDGAIYAFPKNWATPLHQIPNTRVAVSICGELAHLSPEDLKSVDLDVIYNPSREGDDRWVKYRMIGLANPHITKEEIHEILLRDDLNYRQLMNVPDPDARTRFMLANPDFADTWDEFEAEDAITNPPEVRKRQAEDLLEKVYSIARDRAKESSMYVAGVDEALEKKGIIVVRCDNRDSCGVLNPHNNVSLDFEYQDNAVVMDVKFKGTVD